MARAEEVSDRGTIAYTPPAKPQLSPEGQRAVEEFQNNARSRRPADPSPFFERLLASDAQNAKPYIEAFAKLMREAGQDPRLREMWTTYARRYRDDPDAFKGLGQGAFESKDYPSSVAAYTRAIELGSRSPDTFYGRGLSADALGDHQFAVLDAKAALALDPNDGRAFALVKLTEGRPSTAIVNPATGVTHAPQGAPARPPAATAAAVERPVPTAAVESTNSTPYLAADARRRLVLGDPVGALKAALAAAEADPRDAEAQNLVATAYEKTGRHLEAVAAADRALALAPNSVPTLNTRSWALSGLRRFPEALADARVLLGLAPDNPFGLVAEARALGGLGHRSEMIDALSRAAGHDGRFADLRGRAVRLPQNSDTELLFSGVTEAAPAPELAPRRTTRRFLIVLAFTLLGGLLFGLGLLHVFSPAWRERLTGRLRRSSAPGEKPEEFPSVGGIEVKRLIASGGMGVVYEGWDAGLHRKVALKRLRGEIRDDAKERSRFLAEARTVAALEHPSIVRIHSILEEAGELCLVFEFAEGETLRDSVAKDGPLKPGRALALAANLCAGLAHAHAGGFVHRDLKPENVMLDAKGGAKIMDFGLARPPRAASSSTTVWGSPPYCAPEAEDGAATPAGDIYGLGATLYFALVGKPPFSGPAGTIARAKGNGEFLAPSQARKGLPTALDDFMKRSLNPDPAKRFLDAKSFHAALAKALA